MEERIVSPLTGLDMLDGYIGPTNTNDQYAFSTAKISFDLGNATLALRESRKKAQAFRQQTINSFKGYLTPDQVKILDGLRKAAKILR